MSTVKGMGGGEVRVWTEDDFVWVAALPAGCNEYAVCFFRDDAIKLAAVIARMAQEAVSP